MPTTLTVKKELSVMTIYHKHHIIPRHVGGTNDPSNIILLTISEHANAHRLLFEKYNRWQDYVAWQGLTGQIDNQEINRLKLHYSAMEHSRNRVANGTHHLLGGAIQRKLVEEGKHHLLGGKYIRHLVEIGEHNFLGGTIQTALNARRVSDGSHNFIGSNSNLTRLAEGRYPSQIKQTCKHCSKTMSTGMFTRWHGPKCKKANHS